MGNAHMMPYLIKQTDQVEITAVCDAFQKRLMGGSEDWCQPIARYLDLLAKRT
jgi:hypothetical protein